MAKWSPARSVSSRFWLANRTAGLPLLERIDDFGEPSALEQTYASFANVLELAADGTVSNAKHAEYRAAQFIRSYVDPSYHVDPPFEDCEVALH